MAAAVLEVSPSPAFVRNLKVLIVGLGSIGRRHAENLAALGVERIQAVSRRSQYDGVSLHASYEAGLKERPDAVVIANPTAFHARDAAKALRAGSHVYLEKPAGTTAGEISSLAKLAQASKKIVAVGCQLRFNACLERLKEMLDRAVFGRVLDVHVNMGEYLPDYHPDEDYRSSYAARKELGGGVLLTQIHDLNYLGWLFGPFKDVYAVGGKTSDLDINVEDSASFLLRAENGLGVSAHLDYLQRRPLRRLYIAGEKGSAAWDYRQNTLQVTDAQGRTREAGPEGELDRNAMFVEAMRDFLRCAESGGAPRTGLSAALSDLRAVDAVRRSMKNREAAAL